MRGTYLNSVFRKRNIDSQVKSDSFWWWAFVCCSGFILLIGTPVWLGLWRLWHSNEDFNGLVLIPIFVCILLYKTKADFAAVTPRLCKPIFYIVPVTVALMLIANFAGDVRLAGWFLVTSLGLLCFGVFGKDAKKVFLRPLLLLLLMIPPYQCIMDAVTTLLLHLFAFLVDGLSPVLSNGCVIRDGFSFWFDDYIRPMVISTKCSGVRSLMGMCIVASFVMFMDGLNFLGSAAIIAGAAVTALILNLTRIITTIELRLHGCEEYSVDKWHGYLGAVVFIIGVMVISRLSSCLKQITSENQKVLR